MYCIFALWYEFKSCLFWTEFGRTCSWLCSRLRSSALMLSISSSSSAFVRLASSITLYRELISSSTAFLNGCSFSYLQDEGRHYSSPSSSQFHTGQSWSFLKLSCGYSCTNSSYCSVSSYSLSLFSGLTLLSECHQRSLGFNLDPV